MSYLQNAWYAAAWSDEVGDKPFARRLLDTDIVLFRTGENSVAALHDMCPHRFAPLSRGQVVDGAIRCGYHGLSFDSRGECIKSLFAERAPQAIKVRPFTVFERDLLVWIWMGDGEPAPVDTVPRFKHHEDTQLECVFGHTLAKADYRLLSDNLMDLSHTATLHPGLGGLDYLPKVETWEENEDVIARFDIHDMPDFFEPGNGKVVHHRDEIRWMAPAAHLLTSTTTPEGANFHIEIPSAHILTPETAQSTHYFWSSAASVDAGISKEDMRAALVQAFDHEDKPMVEAVQTRMGDRPFWDMKPMLLPTDAGAVRSRRKLDGLIKAERQASEIA